MWKKLSTETGVTDFCIAVNGWIFFSFLHIIIDKESETTVVFLNHTVYASERY